jgi:hypothetical protein
VGTITLKAACGTSTNSGGAGVTTTEHDLGQTSGTFTFTWDAYTVPDQFDVKYENNLLFSTGNISGSGSKSITYSGSSTTITVVVTGSTAGTAWNYTVGCPGSSSSGSAGYDGTYTGTFTSVSQLGTSTGTGTVTVTNGSLTDSSGVFTGTVGSSGNFTGNWTYSSGSLPIPMTGEFSTTSSFTLSGSIGSTVSGTATLRRT